jgi:hypothetical protein
MTDILEEAAAIADAVDELDELRRAIAGRLASMAMASVRANAAEIAAFALSVAPAFAPAVVNAMVWRAGFQAGVIAAVCDRVWAERFLDIMEDGWRAEMRAVMDNIIGRIPVHVPLPWEEEPMS